MLILQVKQNHQRLVMIPLAIEIFKLKMILEKQVQLRPLTMQVQLILLTMIQSK